MNIKKIKKLFKKPGIFFRDYLNNRYPLSFSEIKSSLSQEHFIINSSLFAHQDGNKYLFPIDVVFTWVNDKDPEWLFKYHHELSKTRSEAYGLYSRDSARFSNHDELRYSLYSVRKFLPWVNHIYIVTDNQKPSWLIDDEMVTIIDHREIINEEFLPTFNSHVIESNLHKIKGLSEHFIYFNDDVFVARYLPPSHFFEYNELSSIFINFNKKIDDMIIKTPTYYAIKKGCNLIESKFNFKINYPLVHTYVPLTKSSISLAWDLFNKEIVDFQKNKFRSDYDLNVATFLSPWINYINKLSFPKIDICYYFNIRSSSAKTFYKRLLDIKDISPPHSFCTNDFNSNTKDYEYKDELLLMLDKYYELGRI